MNNSQTLRAGSLLDGGKYRIEKVLGQGGFGITYLAKDIGLDRYVAVKEYFPGDYCSRDGATSRVTLGTEGSRGLVERFKAKFLKEARNIARFDHPCIVRVFSIFEENNTAYYVMEHIEGRSLKDIVGQYGPMSAAAAVACIGKVGAALEYIHARQICHLDVKPANIMVRYSGEPILIDFGISKCYDSAGQQTSTTLGGLSPGFAPIEQYWRDGLEEFSPVTDLYSLAATLYYILTGTVPPEATKRDDYDLTFPSSFPAYLIAPVRKAMSKGRKQRHASVGEFLRELEVRNVEEVDEATEIIVKRPKAGQPPKMEPKQKTKSQPAPAQKSQHLSEPIVAPKSVSKPEVPSIPVKSDKGKKLKFAVGAALLALGVVVTIIAVTMTRGRGPEVASLPADGSISGHEYVDLGLPSGLKWAACNVGASSPSDYGNYYAWGEDSTKSDYTDSNSTTYGKTMGDIGGHPSYDAARANWGGSWRLPTKSEFEELLDKCTWTWASQGGHNGYLVKGPNGRSIFLPAAGWRYGTSLYGAGEDGGFWSSTPYEGTSGSAYYLNFNSGSRSTDWGSRYYGRSVRAVSE